MLGSLTDTLRARLRERGVPFDVEYGPERMRQTSLAKSHIVLERDRERGDVFKGPASNTRNPRIVETWGLGCVCRVYAQSTKNGARARDHEELCDEIVRQIVLSLREIVAANRLRWAITGSGYLSAESMDERGMEAWAGVVYELAFQVDRGISDTEYNGEKAAEATGFSIWTTLTTTGASAVDERVPGATTRVP